MEKMRKQFEILFGKFMLGDSITINCSLEEFRNIVSVLN